MSRGTPPHLGMPGWTRSLPGRVVRANHRRPQAIGSFVRSLPALAVPLLPGGAIMLWRGLQPRRQWRAGRTGWVPVLLGQNAFAGWGAGPV